MRLKMRINPKYDEFETAIGALVSGSTIPVCVEPVYYGKKATNPLWTDKGLPMTDKMLAILRDEYEKCK
jgi:hypothetical protein